MFDRNQVRDRTLILRVLVPSLQVELRDKMLKREEESVHAAEEAAMKMAEKEAEMAEQTGLNNMSSMMGTSVPSNHISNLSNFPKDGQLLDLEGVRCEPSENGSTLWNFNCDGATYPARLVNLPCPVELLKTHDHSLYHKSANIAQVLIVYEDMMALEEVESASGYKVEGFPSYYHSGLTPPMKRVVERRFQAREHKAVAPPKQEVYDVERELQNLIDSISKDSSKAKGKGKGKSSAKSSSSTNVNKIIEDVDEDIVDYEPWMDDYGRQPYGIEFDEKDVMCTKHPELWLDHEDEAEAAREAEKAEARKREERKEKKKKRGGTVDAPTKLTTESSSNDKKNISSSNTTNKSDSSTKKSKKDDGKKKSQKEEKRQGCSSRCPTTK